MATIEDYLDPQGFVDIPRLLKDGKEQEFFPGLLETVAEIRARDFPQISRERVYLDSTATAQAPASVIRQMTEYRLNHPRGSNHSKHSQEARKAQEEYEAAKRKLQQFLGAGDYLIGFSSGTTGTSNWVATRFPFKPGDLFLYTEAEHNSQILTAREFARRGGARVKHVRVHKENSAGERTGYLDLDHLRELVASAGRGRILLNMVHASNFTGNVNPVYEVKKILGDRGFIYLDMAQSAGHIPIDLDTLDVDFAGCSSHKIFGPMGIGAVFVNNRSKRYIGKGISGGSAVELVSRYFQVDSEAPEQFEPGTQDIEGAIEWGMTLDYLTTIGMQRIHEHDNELARYFAGELRKIGPVVKLYGPRDFGRDRVAVVAFNIGTAYDKTYEQVALELDEKGISVRDGCFCVHILSSKLIGLPDWGIELRTLMRKAGIQRETLQYPGAVRASFAFYNDLMDAYKAVQAIREIAPHYRA
ncbi:MAG: aminotransferase class V-fold PLP-dependent enzyme [Candidatus Woesearchaeota archaeon]|jgi:cysteine desulfurase/selenocysteine lyase